MKNIVIKRSLALAAFSWGIAAHAYGLEVLRTDKLSLNVYGRAQMVGVGENVPDPYRDHNRIYLFLKQARIGFKGNYEDVKFDSQFAFGGEDSNGSNTDLSLLDFVADVPVKKLGENAVVKVGQFRVPFSREGLADRGYMNFAERSIASLASYQSRDYGLALMGTKDVWTGTIGTFSSGGRDVPQRYLPERLGVPYLAARFGYNDGVDEDIYHVVQTDLDLKRTTKAAMVNAVYMQDTLIGHSSALQSRTIDKNLLIDSGFNPYINSGPGSVAGNTVTLQRGNLYWLGGDAVVRHPLGVGKAVEGEIEGDWGGYQNRYGVIHIASARALASYQFRPFAISLRYALLSMDNKSGFLSVPSATLDGPVVNNGLGRPIHEITPSLTWHIKGHNLKLIGDLPVYLNCPIWYDNIGKGSLAAPTPLGAYAFPDPTSTTQNSVLATKGNGTARRTVVEARMLFQFMF
ncbi:MAG TPA: porin [Elusimicrobiota bacterium]|jgi:hypothetical protein|nr:porin [Elusimicrobiota bacterium]